MGVAGRLLIAAAGLLAIAASGNWPWPQGRPTPRVPGDNPMSAAKVALGRRLFYDADLSVDGSMACSSCHVQRHAFADSTPTHPGVHGEPGRRNAPGLANVAWARTLTWGDPRVTTLEAQVRIPVLGTSPVEMGMHGQEAEIVRRLARDGCYAQMFRTAFPADHGRIDMDNVARALAAFERTLASHDAPFDRWRGGDGSALTSLQRAGAGIFRRSCAACHAGPDLRDDRFHAIEPATADPGLGEITKRSADNGRFRTPGLRNVLLTAPYLHDGSARTPEEAIARHRAIPLDEADTQVVIAFLGALTDRSFTTDKRYSLPDEACGVKL